jgi:hypothetical protein
MTEIGKAEMEIVIFTNKWQWKLDTSVEYTLKNSVANYDKQIPSPAVL